MAATPFTGSLIGRVNGKLQVLRFSASDVADARVTFTDLDGDTNYAVPARSRGFVIEDIIISSAGVDTSALQLIKGSAATTVILDDALLASTTIEAETRAQGLIGTALEPGEQYGLKQLA